MFPIIFHIGYFRIYSYGLMVALGFLVTGFLLRRELKRTSLPTELANSIVIWAVLGGVGGSKLYSAIESLSNPNTGFLATLFSGSGLVWYGGLIGGTIAVLIVIWHSRAPMIKVIDLIAPLLILGYAFGRMGCFLSGDGDYGPVTGLPWGMAFPNGVVPTLERVHPTPLYEIILSMMAFTFLWRARKHNMPMGWIFSMYLILAGTERFITEFWRLTPIVAFGMTVAQFISVVMIATGTIMMLHYWKLRAMVNRFFKDTRGELKA